LRPYAGWKRCENPTLEIEKLPPEQLVGIYQSLDPIKGKITPMLIEDILVHNIPKSPSGGLQAHDYWDNIEDFIQPVAGLLRDVAAGGAG